MRGASQQESSRGGVHPSSLVHVSTHSSTILELTKIPLSRRIIDYVVERSACAVEYAVNRDLPEFSPIHIRSAERMSSFTAFVNKVLVSARSRVPTILVTLAYIDRARLHLNIAQPLGNWELERVFLGALILASKYTNDSALKNGQWATCTGTFGRRDIGRVERELLDVLDYELGVTEDEILAFYDDLIPEPSSGTPLLTKESRVMEIVLEREPSAKKRPNQHLTPATQASAHAVAQSMLLFSPSPDCLRKRKHVAIDDHAFLDSFPMPPQSPPSRQLPCSIGNETTETKRPRMTRNGAPVPSMTSIHLKTARTLLEQLPPLYTGGSHCAKSLAFPTHPLALKPLASVV